MYDKQQIKELQSLTQDLLLLEKLAEDAAGRIDELRNVLRFHESRHDVTSDPLITDFEDDRLYKFLERTEAKHPHLVRKDSPTQRVGSSLNAAFPTVQHLVPMLSLENSYTEEDLVAW